MQYSHACLPPSCVPQLCHTSALRPAQSTTPARPPSLPPSLPNPCSCGGDKFQDGAVVANNPTLVAMQEARLLWPEHSVDAVISLGVGLAPPSRREKGMTSFMDTGAILIESR